MKFLFFVQGEGRGHMTQAIALCQILRNAGHEVSRVLIGKSSRRQIPAFFAEKIGAPVETFESPNFSSDSRNKGVRILPTIVQNLIRIGKYRKIVGHLNRIILQENPDMVINFYELLAGILYHLHKPKVPMVCIGHQYLLLHPEFPYPKGRWLDKSLLRINTRITSAGAKKLLALSFSSMADVPKKNLFVVPPLLRREVMHLKIHNGKYFHGYMLNTGYADEVSQWHKNNPETELHFFWDKKDAVEVTKISPNLTFHQINDEKFLDYMRGCKAFATTAGFESICEAMFLNKPVLMVPTAGHFEQKCNALDASLAGAGITAKSFDLSRLSEFIPNYSLNHSTYKQWVSQSEIVFLKYLTGQNS